MPSSAARSSAPRAMSVKNGLRTSSTIRPMLRLRPARSCRAASLRTKPSCSIACRTRSTVAGATFAGLLSTFETVPTDTDAAAATSRTLTATPVPVPSPRIEPSSIIQTPERLAVNSARRSATRRRRGGPATRDRASRSSRPPAQTVFLRSFSAASGLSSASTSSTRR